MPLRQVLHFRDSSATDVGAVRAAIEFGEKEARRLAQQRSEESLEERKSSKVIPVIIGVLALIACAAAAYGHQSGWSMSALKAATPSAALQNAELQAELPVVEITSGASNTRTDTDSAIPAINNNAATHNPALEVSAEAVHNIVVAVPAVVEEEIAVAAPEPPQHSETTTQQIQYENVAEPATEQSVLVQQAVVVEEIVLEQAEAVATEPAVSASGNPSLSATPQPNSNAAAATVAIPTLPAVVGGSKQGHQESSSQAAAVVAAVVCGLLLIGLVFYKRGSTQTEQNKKEEIAVEAAADPQGDSAPVEGSEAEEPTEDGDQEHSDEAEGKDGGPRHRRQPTTHEGIRPKHGDLALDNAAAMAAMGGANPAATERTEKVGHEVTVTKKEAL